MEWREVKQLIIPRIDMHLKSLESAKTWEDALRIQSEIKALRWLISEIEEEKIVISPQQYY